MNWLKKLFRETVPAPQRWNEAADPNRGNESNPFGGLWTDRADAHELLARRADMSSDERTRVAHWIDTGYVVLPSVLTAAQCDLVVNDVLAAVDRGERQMAYWKDGAKHIHAAQPNRLMEFECKVLDVHATIESSRRALFAPGVARFLELIFDDRSVAFQTLYLERGSEQGVHQDTAFVYVNPPLDFAASWIALEDIRPGSGELEYYPGSHRLPHTLFGAGKTKAYDPTDPVAHRYADYLHEKCAGAGLSIERFLPKKGDALIWAADLVHGGAQRSAEISRRSLVTHYCPARRRPPYAQSDSVLTEDKTGNYWLSQT